MYSASSSDFTPLNRGESRMLRMLIRAIDPAQRAAAEVAPWQIFAEIAALTGAELFEVVRRPHPTDVKEILVLADSQRSGPVGFPFGAKHQMVTSVLSTAMGRITRICVEN